jgi:hypothetical protein
MTRLGLEASRDKARLCIYKKEPPVAAGPKKGGPSSEEDAVPFDTKTRQFCLAMPELIFAI